ncbi:MAG: DsbA family protein [Caldilineaceae bacterium]|nr:DsbA family protein [Caldilineaceae bacterium]
MATVSKKKAAAAKRSSSTSNIGLWLIGASVAIVALVVAIIVINDQRTKTAPVAQPELPAEWIGDGFMGNPEATVVIQAWEDFLCPSCQNWTRVTKPQLFEQYIKPGLVRLEFHHFPLQSHAPGSFMTALAVECAGDQGMFWPYHDKIFQTVSSDQQAAATFEKLIEYAQGMQMDVQRFSACMSGQEHQDEINQSLALAGQLGLRFTPSILVNGQLVEDSSFGSLKSVIDAELGTQSQ